MLAPHINVARPHFLRNVTFFNAPIFIKQFPNKLFGTFSVPDCVQIGGKI